MTIEKLTEAMKEIMVRSYTSGATPAEGGAAIGAFAKLAIVAGVPKTMIAAAWQEADLWLRTGGLAKALQKTA